MDFSDMSWHHQRAAGLHAMPYDIVGYVYKTDTYCPDCILRVFHDSPTGQPPIAGMTIEQHLDVVARMRGINRADQSSFDNGEFPVPMFRQDLTPCEHCMTEFGIDGDDEEFDCGICDGVGNNEFCGRCRLTLGA
jgi:hypothetical protein